MNQSGAYDCREIAQTIRGQKPPYRCPACQKEYKSLTGILYHIGQFGPTTNAPRCVLGEETPQGSPRPSRGSPQPAQHPSSPAGGGSVRRRPRRELTYGEAQRLVEVDFDSNYRRVEIDNHLEMNMQSDNEEEDESPITEGTGKKGGGPRTPAKKGRGGTKSETPSRGKLSSSAVKNKAKRKSKLKSSKEEGHINLPVAEIVMLDNLEYSDAPSKESSYFRFVEQSAEDLDENIEYDMDEEDYQWLSLVNEDRKSQGLTCVPQEVFEILMDRLEKECVFESQTFGEGVDSAGKNMYNIDENAECCICNDGECHNTNAILFCDMCNLAVHQECYGVPYIPEGQWLCRRCIESPSRGVDCALCPNKGGAFKRTLDGRWAHVTCAIWIPEVQFSNPVFLEPIDGIKEIPPARWRLNCYVCRKQMGACIQCAKPNCYTAFHVTCAQHANLHMKVEVTKGGEVRKFAYCDAHTPPSVKRKMEKAAREKEKKEKMEEVRVDVVGNGEEDGEGGVKNEGGAEGGAVAKKEDDTECGGSKKEGENGSEEKEEDGEDMDELLPRTVSNAVKKARKMMEEKKGCNVPVVNIPYVPQHRLDVISNRVSLHKKIQFIPKLVSYWKLKRQSRNGVPLLRRLQANKGQRAKAANLTEEEREVLLEQLSQWKVLRHDLERARLLIELVRKREKLKREQLRLLHTIGELQLRPLTLIMRRVLDRIARKDPADIFADPVSIEEVPDYLDIIRKPMDFTTMRKKVEENAYTSLEDFEKDFRLVWHNATIYNTKDTIYYKAAIRIKEAGQKILEQAREQIASAGVSSKLGMHNPPVQEPPPLTPSSISKMPDILKANEESMLEPFRERHPSTTSQISLDEQIDFLQEKLYVIQSQSGSKSKRKEKSLRRELTALKRQIRNERKISETDEGGGGGSPRRHHHRAPSIPRNAEELASHLLHGSLRMTPSRQQILSYSGIRLEERASAMKREAEEKGEGLVTATPTVSTKNSGRGRLHSSSDSMLLQMHKQQAGSSSAVDAGGGGESRQQRTSSVPPKSLDDAREESSDESDDDDSSDESSSSSDEDSSEDLSEEEDEEEEEEEEFVIKPAPLNSRKRKKGVEPLRIQKRQKLDNSRGKTTAKTQKDASSPVKGGRLKPQTSKTKTSKARGSNGKSKKAPAKKSRAVAVRKGKSDMYVESLKKARNIKRKKLQRAEEGAEEEAVPTRQNSKRKGGVRSRASPNKAKRTAKKPEEPLPRRRLRSMDTISSEESEEFATPLPPPVNGVLEVSPRKLGSTPVVKNSQRTPRSHARSNSSSYSDPLRGQGSNQAGDDSSTDTDIEAKKRSCFSDSEVKGYPSGCSGGVPSASSNEDLTVLGARLKGTQQRRKGGWGDQRGLKRKASMSSGEEGGPPMTKKHKRGNSDSSEGGGARGGLNGMILNGGENIKPMDLVWAKCRGYPPYPALVIDPSIPPEGISVQGEKIKAPSDEVLELQAKNPSATFLVRFFDGRRTWQWLPPEKIEPLGVSSKGDNSKIAMAGSSKRSVKEAYTRAKLWLRKRRRQQNSSSSGATPTSKHLPVVEDADSAAELSSEGEDNDVTTNLFVDSNVQSDA